MSANTWTYEGYWAVVLGGNRDAADVVREFELNPADRRGLDEWIGAAEVESWRVGGHGEMPENWSEFHQRALAELCAVVTE